MGSTCPAPAEGATNGHSANLEWSRGWGASVVPAGSACPELSEAARSRALELEHSWGLAGNLVPTGSTCLVSDDARHREGKSEPALANAFLSANRIPVRSREATIVYSVVVHTFLLGVVLLLPLWFTDAVDPAKFLATLLVAPPQFTTAPAPPAAAPAEAAAPAQPAVRRIFMQGNRLLFPTAIPKHAAVISEGALEPEIGVGGVFGGVYGGVPGGLGAELFGAMSQPAPPLPALPADPVVEQPRGPLRVGGDVRPPKLISQVDPAYPRLARQARVEGDVVLSAIINEGGEIMELKAKSGPPILYSAALDAVRQWKFEPTYLNGRPWPISYEITVHFRL